MGKEVKRRSKEAEKRCGFLNVLAIIRSMTYLATPAVFSIYAKNSRKSLKTVTKKRNPRLPPL